MVEERERGGGWRSLGDLAGRSGAFGETLGRLAWAGACDELLDGPVQSRRRRALWELGVAVPGTRCRRAPSSRCRSSRTRARAARAVGLGADAGGLRLHRASRCGSTRWS